MIGVLADICRNEILMNKILLVPSYTVGQNIISSLASKTPVFNLRIETVQSIAYQFGMPLLGKNNETLIDDSMSRRIMFSIIYRMRQNSEFEYFAGIQATPSVSDIIWNAVMEIKYAGISCECLNETNFVCPEKGRDIKRIIENYESELRNKKLTDYPGLIRKILDCNEDRDDTLIIIPNFIKLRLLEKKLIESKFASVRVIYDEPLDGICAPIKYYSSNYPEKETVSSPFAGLYAPEKRRNDCDFSHIRIVKAYGESNEIDAVLRDILYKGISFDSVCIYTASREPYAQLLYQKAKLLGINISFGYGISVFNSVPGKVFSIITEWINSNYRVSYLTKMLYQGLIEISGKDAGEITQFQAANALRAAGIGWGRERYLSVLDENIVHLQDENGDDEKTSDRVKILLSVRQFVETVLSMIPDSADRMVNLNELAKGISEFISTFAKVKSELDAEARTAITESLNMFSAELTVDIGEGLRILDNTIRGIRIGISGPAKGSIHLTDFDNGLYVNRTNHYFTGLDADRFPGKTGEDPVLLDTEKQVISEHIPLNRDKPAENIYKLTELMASVEGNITLTYPSFDPAENRDKIPSSYILQVYRMISGNSAADYSDLGSYLSKTEGYITDDALDEGLFWLSRYYKDIMNKKIKDNVIDCYPHLKHGTDAWDNRESDRFTCYDGYVGSLGILKGNEVFSASRLELLAKCPYQYFLRYVLNVSLPDELVYDPETWLDPLQKGLLYHVIFERFYKIVTSRNEKPGREAHLDLILEIAESAIQEFRDMIPPPSEIVFDVEKREILESCKIFLAEEEENYDGGVPVEFELAFGVDGAAYPPVEIPLGPERKILLSGKIDRVDKLDENTYRIVDYKSGGTYGFSDRDFFRQGRQLQHALYAYALKVLLQNTVGTGEVKVKEGVYIFPTRKGGGRRFIRTQCDISGLIALLNSILDVMQDGVFAPAENTEDCRWCDYNVVCRVHRLQDVTAAKRNDQSVPALEALRRLNDYD